MRNEQKQVVMKEKERTTTTRTAAADGVRYDHCIISVALLVPTPGTSG